MKNAQKSRRAGIRGGRENSPGFLTRLTFRYLMALEIRRSWKHTYKLVNSIPQAIRQELTDRDGLWWVGVCSRHLARPGSDVVLFSLDGPSRPIIHTYPAKITS